MRLKMSLPGLSRLSLRVVLVVYVIVPLVTSIAVTGYLALAMWENQVEERMKNDLEMVAKAIQLPLSHAMERDRKGGVEQALESAFSLDSIYSAYAYDKKGKQIASAGKQDPDKEQAKMTQLASEGKRKGEYGRLGDRKVYSYFTPLKDSKNHTSGLLRLTRREEDFQDYIRKVRWYGAGGLATGSLIMIVLVLFGHQQALGRHFQRLISGMKRVADGESNYRIPKKGPQEIASITESFNSMLDTIQSAENEIMQKREEQLELEKQLKQKEKLAAVGQLAAGVAHELGTPLSTISGTAERGLRHEEEETKRAKSFTRIRREVDRMQVIIRQLLDFSHSQDLQCRTLKPHQVAHSAASAVAEEAQNNNAHIAVEGEDKSISFYGDPIRLEQALVNLLRNAIQAESEVTVRINWRVEGDNIVFTVEDNGPGIPEEIRPRLFEPFFTTKNVGSGTGLGLAVVHGIIEEHGGSVEAGQSEEGGARVVLSLPLAPPNNGE